MRVLLAEDDKRLGKLIQYMLEQNEIQVEWVTSGSDIYEYAMYTDYDILVLPSCWHACARWAAAAPRRSSRMWSRSAISR